MAYEKADFWAAYRIYAVDPLTNYRFARFKSPSIEGGAEMTCILHYHPAAMKPNKAALAQRVIQHYIDQGTPLTGTSTVAVIGGAFGWLGEALEDLVPGLEASSLDTSQYVQDVKALSPDDELQEQLEADGYDISTGPGLYMFDKFKDANPRSRRPEMIAQNDLSTVKLRNDARKMFQKNDIDHIITEEVWQLLTQEEKDRYTLAAADYGATLTHIINNVIIAG